MTVNPGSGVVKTIVNPGSLPYEIIHYFVACGYGRRYSGYNNSSNSSSSSSSKNMTKTKKLITKHTHK